MEDVILAGEPVRNRNVVLLVNMLGGDELSAKLERGLGDENAIVALSSADRQRIVAVLEHPPGELAGLRAVLVKQMKQQKERELRSDQRHRR